MKKTVFSLFLILSLFILPATSPAAAILDFSILAPQPANSIISYAGGTSPLIGNIIAITSVVGMDTPQNNGTTLVITNGKLLFQTGSYSGGGSSVWNFSTGQDSKIELRGGIPALLIPNDTLLLWGSGSISGSVTPLGSTFKVAILSFVDEKNEALKEYYGLLNSQYFEGNLNLSFLTNNAPPNAFTSTQVLSGDVVNQVPIPAPVWLFISGLLGLVGVRRRLNK